MVQMSIPSETVHKGHNLRGYRSYVSSIKEHVFVMDGVIRYQGRPSSVRCIQWSADAEIALAFTNHAEILLPKYPLSQSRAKEGENSRWHVVRIQTNTFSIDENPYMQPKPTAKFSIGAEQSSSHIVSLEWSAPGLTDSRRCALAILTSNHVLSIWAPTGSATDSRNWHRMLVINHCLESGSKDSPQAPDQDDRPSLIRAFTWSSSKFVGQDDTTLRAKNSNSDAHYLAAINHSGEVFVIRVISASTTLPLSEHTWQATVVHKSELGEAPRHSDPIFSENIFSNRISQEYMCPINGMYWSPWVTSKFSTQIGVYSVLAVVTREFVWLKLTTLLGDNHDCTLSISNIVIRIPGNYKGGLGWVIKGGKLNFIFEEDLKTTCYEVQIDESKESCLLAKRTWSLSSENVWVKVSGTAYDPFDKTFHISHHSTVDAQDSRVVCSVPVNATDSEGPKWQNSIRLAVNAFSSQNQLHGHVLVKTWGLSNGPTDEYVARLFTLHPSQMLQYEQYARASSSLEISYQGHEISRLAGGPLGTTNGLLPSTCVTSSFEALHFSLIRLLRAVEKDENAVHTVSCAIPDVLHHSGLLQPRRVPGSLNGDFDLILKLQERVYMSDIFVASFTTELKVAAGLLPTRDASSRTGVIKNLARTILSTTIHRSILSTVDASIVALSRYLVGARSTNGDGSFQHDTDLEGNQSLDPPVEDCSICNQQIVFESVHSAVCASGHRFARCSMSFLSIQKPGVTKSCRTCKAPYLQDRRLTETQASEPPPVIADILSRVVHVCIFCGGKFDT